MMGKWERDNKPLSAIVVLIGLNPGSVKTDPMWSQSELFVILKGWKERKKMTPLSDFCLFILYGVNHSCCYVITDWFQTYNVLMCCPERIPMAHRRALPAVTQFSTGNRVTSHRFHYSCWCNIFSLPCEAVMRAIKQYKSSHHLLISEIRSSVSKPNKFAHVPMKLNESLLKPTCF